MTVWKELFKKLICETWGFGLAVKVCTAVFFQWHPTSELFGFLLWVFSYLFLIFCILLLALGDDKTSQNTKIWVTAVRSILHLTSWVQTCKRNGWFVHTVRYLNDKPGLVKSSTFNPFITFITLHRSLVSSLHKSLSSLGSLSNGSLLHAWLLRKKVTWAYKANYKDASQRDRPISSCNIFRKFIFGRFHWDFRHIDEVNHGGQHWGANFASNPKKPT